MVFSGFAGLTQLTDHSRMISTIRQRKLLPTLVMLFALAGLSLSVIGASFSHGVAELAFDWRAQVSGHPDSHHGHGHSHDIDQDSEKASPHHDAGNHTHETADQLRIPFVSHSLTVPRQPVCYAGDTPSSLPYRLERPPRTHSLA